MFPVELSRQLFILCCCGGLDLSTKSAESPAASRGLGHARQRQPASYQQEGRIEIQLINYMMAVNWGGLEINPLFLEFLSPLRPTQVLYHQLCHLGLAINILASAASCLPFFPQVA